MAACGNRSAPPTKPLVENRAPVAPAVEDPACVARLSGKVIDEPTGEPLVNVAIAAGTRLKPSGAWAITDDDGKFTLEKLAAYDLLTVSYGHDWTAEGALPRRCDPITVAIDTREASPAAIVPIVIR
jgi:hypothetical protein